MMAHEQATMDAAVYFERTLKVEGKKEKRRKHGKKGKSYRPDQAGSEEELNASPARQLMDISRKLPGGSGHRRQGLGARIGQMIGRQLGRNQQNPGASPGGQNSGGLSPQNSARPNRPSLTRQTGGRLYPQNPSRLSPQNSGRHSPQNSGRHSPQNSGRLSRQDSDIILSIEHHIPRPR
ncbi:unnamed protein product [Aphanomyces euteiches]